MLPNELTRLVTNRIQITFGFLAIVLIGCLSSTLTSTPTGSTVMGTVSQQEVETKATVDNATQIEDVLSKQTELWNQHDIEGFMQTYWNSDQMTFSGGGKTRRGWQATLDSYKRSYPGDKMGKLHFDGLEVELLSDHAAFVLGFWHLEMNGEKKDGNFTLVLKKMDGEWKIIHDHSSTDESEDEQEAAGEKKN